LDSNQLVDETVANYKFMDGKKIPLTLADPEKTGLLLASISS
jgi:hypothetical protein